MVTLLKHTDDAVVGNAALCLGHCTALPKVCKALAKTNIVMDLLVLARDQAKPTVQHNCAICIAKLAQSDPRYSQSWCDISDAITDYANICKVYLAVDHLKLNSWWQLFFAFVLFSGTSIGFENFMD